MSKERGVTLFKVNGVIYIKKKKIKKIHVHSLHLYLFAAKETTVLHRKATCKEVAISAAATLGARTNLMFTCSQVRCDVKSQLAGIAVAPCRGLNSPWAELAVAFCSLSRTQH